MRFNDGIGLHWRLKNVFLLFVSDYGRCFTENKIYCPIFILRSLWVRDALHFHDVHGILKVAYKISHS